MKYLRAWAVLVSFALSPACGRTTDQSDLPRPSTASIKSPRPQPSPDAFSASADLAPDASLDVASVRALDTSAYPWLADQSISSPEPVDCLEDRFPPPSGYSRVALTAGTFGAWLRRLPLAAPDTLVKSYAGGVLYEPGHPNIAAVVAIDPGTADLQQCADSVIRLHAEWQWSQGKREMTWRAAAGTMPYQRWVNGDKPVAKGASLTWESGKARPRDNHSSFRKYLDAVFMFANTGSLAQQAKPIGLAELVPGDFMVMPGAPGHAVLILDVARSQEGKQVVLLGQGYMPAQNFQVLRPSASQNWFEIDADSPGLKTPFWRRFPWSLLRRL
jgi:hypothetical protein